MGFFTSNNHFKLFQGVTTWADIDDYSKNAKTVIVGHVGTEMLNPQPSVLPLIDVLRDFHQLHVKTNGEGEPPTWFKTGKHNIRDWIPTADQTPSTSQWVPVTGVLSRIPPPPPSSTATNLPVEHSSTPSSSSSSSTITQPWKTG
eukprot:scaffold82776_cov61-Attheya_sp.AAC.3